ncbi:Fic family protein [Deinococcus aetherius]|uniref:Fic family protein n=1 Tax=Deinococcus aetherius TaxID=200252 RepID=UPI002231046E|nr:Fic family protein [Deinococcus aetherius]
MGQIALMEQLGLSLPEPHVRSYIINGARRTVERPDRTEHFYPPQYLVGETVRDHLRFTLRYEAFDLRVLIAAFGQMGGGEIARWVMDEPTGAYSRRAWFLYEHFTGERLDLPDITMGNYVDALDAGRHIVATPVNSPRHRVRDNLLGTRDLCVTVRRTETLKELRQARLDLLAQQLITQYDPHTLARAVTYLYTKETRSSYDIEGETPSHDRFEGFVRVLREAATFTPTPEALVRLQNQIVDPRFAVSGVRDNQNYVGEATRFGEYVHYVCPKPEDVPTLMRGWSALTERLLNDPQIDPVIAAACIAFSFVFIHPFEDGNGRIHRFLIHHTLAKRKYSPPGVIFPVSASILRSKDKYDEVLETFSRPLLAHLSYELNEQWEMTVPGDTYPLYRAFDATAFAEYLYARVRETVERDLKEELSWITAYDDVYAIVTGVVDMPDRMARNLTRYFVQEGGRLSNHKRRQFSQITEAEIAEMTALMARLFRPERESGDTG